MIFACKAAPGGPMQAERGEARKGRAERRVRGVVLVALRKQSDQDASRSSGRQRRADRRLSAGRITD
jgi:hypothetical protein